MDQVLHGFLPRRHQSFDRGTLATIPLSILDSCEPALPCGLCTCGSRSIKEQCAIDSRRTESRARILNLNNKDDFRVTSLDPPGTVGRYPRVWQWVRGFPAP